MADEYIKREDVLSAQNKSMNLAECRKRLERLPAADVAPIKHGRWIKLDMHSGMEQYKCSACNQECYVPTCIGEPLYDYCPNCGVKMTEGRT